MICGTAGAAGAASRRRSAGRRRVVAVSIRSGFLLVALWSAACGSDATSPVAPPPGSGSAPQDLVTEDLVVGTGLTAVGGRILTVDYTGWIYDDRQPDNKGTQFDTSVGREPFVFPLGVRAVVTGWDQGLVGMRVGGIRRLTIPPSLAYGVEGAPPTIPGNATLLFEVTLLDVH